MDHGAEARARQLTAVLIEAVGHGVPADLSAKIMNRLGSTTRSRLRPSVLVAILMAAAVVVVFGVARLQGERRGGVAPAQEPEKAVPVKPKPADQDAEPVAIAIRCVTEGEAVPREQGRAKGARQWEGRELAWQVRDRSLDSLESLARHLRTVVNDPALRRPRPAPEGGSEPPAVVVEPATGARFGEVVAVTDAAMAAGFAEILWAGIGKLPLLPKSLAEPVIDGGAIVVPHAVFSEPDDAPDELRVTCDLYQDGRIALDGEILFTPAASGKDDLAPVRNWLQARREALAAKGQLDRRTPDGKMRLRPPLLLRADVWTEWTHVQRLIALADEAGFWKIEYGVSD